MKKILNVSIALGTTIFLSGCLSSADATPNENMIKKYLSEDGRGARHIFDATYYMGSNDAHYQGYMRGHVEPLSLHKYSMEDFEIGYASTSCTQQSEFEYTCDTVQTVTPKQSIDKYFNAEGRYDKAALVSRAQAFTSAFKRDSVYKDDPSRLESDWAAKSLMKYTWNGIVSGIQDCEGKQKFGVKTKLKFKKVNDGWSVVKSSTPRRKAKTCVEA